MSESKKKKIFGLSNIVIFIAVGIFTLVYSYSQKGNYVAISLGLSLSITSIAKNLYYGLKNNKDIYDIVAFYIAIIGIVIGTLFLCILSMNIELMCQIWGIYEIVNSIVEIVFHCQFIKSKRTTVIELLISLAEIIFGILLCIHLKEGIHVHLIFLSITCFLNADVILLDDVLLVNN